MESCVPKIADFTQGESIFRPNCMAQAVLYRRPVLPGTVRRDVTLCLVSEDEEVVVVGCWESARVRGLPSHRQVRLS